jgi:hypothetical protein
MMVLAVGLVASFQTIFDSFQWNSIRMWMPAATEHPTAREDLDRSSARESTEAFIVLALTSGGLDSGRGPLGLEQKFPIQREALTYPP